ncbi:hypothetical protein ACFWBG_00595 [Nocardia salmonicida]|uniref:hypothetical protein n=1 Tax=Nocardia salmonicida TaxID=53431 RepID=UPI00366B619E
MVDANAMRRNLSEALGMTMRGLIGVMFGRSASVTADDPYPGGRTLRGSSRQMPSVTVSG